ncbi:MAG: acylhydrolase [Bacteroidales bacterium]|nr:acylhydrolase [Bacteroidales bacterium]
MKKSISVLIVLMLSAFTALQAASYTVVFMGDSITELWLNYHRDSYFTPNAYLGKGISGQTTAKMMARFKSDVTAYKPKAVVIMAGTNDIARNDGYVPYEKIVENIMKMAAMAEEAGAKVAIISVLPADAFWWNTSLRPAGQLRRLNTILQQKTLENGYVWVDMYPAMLARGGAIDPTLSDDAIHPNPKGYELMEQIIQPYLEEML